ncbi:hypothetical protein ABZX30_07060 [Streptomyces sp. NPDC004542]|uniref:hypothetical protein n=1 Tax=Streptomyces sp. NPDC004542 TaxID=3154281 RepID=UPI0033A7901E
MGERLSGGGLPDRRRARPGGAGSGPDVDDTGALETALAAALREGDPAPEGELRALAAFRTAGAAGAHRARTRRRDDWRRPAERRAGRSVKVTLGVVFAGLTLSGVAVAAIGSAGSSAKGAGDGRGTAHPSPAAPGRPGGTASPTAPDGRKPADRPAAAQDTEAHCRAYEQVEGRGKALGATAWQRLVAAAGGKDEVAAYCAERLARATAGPGGTGGTGGTGNPGAGSAGGGSGNGNGNGNGNGRSGNTGTGAGTAGNGRASADKGGTKHR